MTVIRIPFEGPVLHRHRLEVRVGDVNYGNHLGHDALVGLLHEARVRYLAGLGMHELDVDGASLAVASLAVRYRAEAFLGERLVVEIAAGELASRRAELLYRMRSEDRDRVVADASTVLVFIAADTGRVTTVPDRLRAALTGRAEV